MSKDTLKITEYQHLEEQQPRVTPIEIGRYRQRKLIKTGIRKRLCTGDSYLSERRQSWPSRSFTDEGGLCWRKNYNQGNKNEEDNITHKKKFAMCGSISEALTEKTRGIFHVVIAYSHQKNTFLPEQ